MRPESRRQSGILLGDQAPHFRPRMQVNDRLHREDQTSPCSIVKEPFGLFMECVVTTQQIARGRTNIVTSNVDSCHQGCAGPHPSISHCVRPVTSTRPTLTKNHQPSQTAAFTAIKQEILTNFMLLERLHGYRSVVGVSRTKVASFFQTCLIAATTGDFTQITHRRPARTYL